jgi:hypothetical protein
LHSSYETYPSSASTRRHPTKSPIMPRSNTWERGNESVTLPRLLPLLVGESRLLLNRQIVQISYICGIRNCCREFDASYSTEMLSTHHN